MAKSTWGGKRKGAGRKMARLIIRVGDIITVVNANGQAHKVEVVTVRRAHMEIRPC